MENDRLRPTLLNIWDQLFEADWECQNIEEYYLAEIEVLKNRVSDLEKRFLKDPLNSHKPPSSEPFKKPKRTRSLKEKSGKSPGAQNGHKGKTIEQRSEPHETRLHPVYQCGRCGHRLKPLPVTQCEIRQVIDLKNGKPYVIEHKAEMKVCPKCNSMNHGGFPSEAKAYVCYGPEVKRMALYFGCYQLLPLQRTKEVLAHVFDLTVSIGTLCRWLVEAGKTLRSWENKTKAEIIDSKVAGFDETGLRVKGKMQWLHVSSTRDQTLMVPHLKRGSEAWDEIGILPDFKGKAVHDGFTAYWKYENFQHVLCNAHHLRELQFIYEVEVEQIRTQDRPRGYEKHWALEMGKLLKSALHHIHKTLEKNIPPRIEWSRSIEKRYESILKKGYRTYRSKMPRTPSHPREGPKEKRDPGHLLLRRLHFYQKETLAFLRDSSIPFTNNQAERDFRMAKVKQKISGCFRSQGGALAFFRVRSFISTKRKQGMDPFHSLADLFSLSNSLN